MMPSLFLLLFVFATVCFHFGFRRLLRFDVIEVWLIVTEHTRSSQYFLLFLFHRLFCFLQVVIVFFDVVGRQVANERDHGELDACDGRQARIPLNGALNLFMCYFALLEILYPVQLRQPFSL